jgi:hypothetical protein
MQRIFSYSLVLYVVCAVYTTTDNNPNNNINSQ